MYKRKLFRLHLRSGILRLGERTLIMGVLNITPDSFSDGGEFLDPKLAVKQALAMQRDGADIIDIGAESTRPGSEGISAPEELRRLLPVLEAVRGRLKIPVSVDTQKSAVAEIALGAAAIRAPCRRVGLLATFCRMLPEVCATPSRSPENLA
jgi:dihydropteroate synthase